MRTWFVFCAAAVVGFGLGGADLPRVWASVPEVINSVLKVTSIVRFKVSVSSASDLKLQLIVVHRENLLLRGEHSVYSTRSERDLTICDQVSSAVRNPAQPSAFHLSSILLLE